MLLGTITLSPSGKTPLKKIVPSDNGDCQQERHVQTPVLGDRLGPQAANIAGQNGLFRF